MEIGTEALLEYLGSELDLDTSDIGADTPLFSSGLIDSFSLVNLLASLETRCGFRIPATDVTLDNFDTVGRISAYVARATGVATRRD